MLSTSDLKKGFRGHAYKGREFVGGVYVKDGRVFVANVEYGRVISATEFPASAFRKAGSERVSESCRIARWEVA